MVFEVYREEVRSRKAAFVMIPGTVCCQPCFVVADLDDVEVVAVAASAADTTLSCQGRT